MLAHIDNQAEIKRKRKISQLWCLAKDLNMDNEMLHVAVYGLTGKESIRKLTYPQLVAVVKTLTTKKQQDRRRNYAKNSTMADQGVHLLATPDQRELVKNLMAVITNKLQLKYPNSYLEAICKRTFNSTFLKLNRQQMIKLIETLKSIQNRKVNNE